MPATSPATWHGSLDGVAKADPAAIQRKLDLRVLPLIFFGALASAVDKSSVSYASKAIQADLRFSDRVYGFGAGVYFLGYSLVLIPSSIAAVRVGPARWVAYCCCAWGSVAACFALLQSEAQFYTLRTMLGVTEAGGATMIYCLTLFYTSRSMNTAYALVHLASPASQLVGGLLAAALLPLRWGSWQGWRLLFAVEGLATVAYSFVLLRYLPNSVSEAPFLSRAEKEYWQSQLDAAVKPHAGQAEEEGGAWQHGVHRVFCDWRVYYLGLVLFLLNIAVSGMQFWLPLLTDAIMHGTLSGSAAHGDRGFWSQHGAVLLAMVPFCLSGVTAYAVAVSARRHNEHRCHAAAPMMLAAVAFSLLPKVFNTCGAGAAFLAITLAACAVFSVHGPVMAWPASFMQGPAASTGLAIMKCMGGLGSFVGPAAIGALKQAEQSYDGAMLLLAAVLVAAATLCIGLRPDLQGVSMCPPGGRRSAGKGSYGEGLHLIETVTGDAWIHKRRGI